VTVVDLDERWGGVDGMFGGHVFSTIADAAAEESEHRLAAMTLCFMSGVQPGEVDLQLTSLHAGRRTATCRFELVQADRLCVHGVTEHATPTGGLQHVRQVRPPARPVAPVAMPEGLESLEFRRRFDTLLVADPDLEGCNGAWIRFRDPPHSVGVRTPAGILATLLDVMPPGLFTREPKPRFVPTLSFTAHFGPLDELDPGAWLYLTHATAWATDTLCVDESTVWTAEGRLLAQGRQTRSVRWSE
jgi:acyl-CoA thioesterase